MDLLQWNLYKADTVNSNMNEVIRAVLTFLLFFTKGFCTHHKAPKITKKDQKSPKITKKHQKIQKRNQAKAQNANKRTKIENALKKHLSGKKQLIRLFEFLCFLCTQRKKK